MHYTASDSAAGSIAWLRSPASKASANFVVAQDGVVYCLVPDDTIAWHAGASRYRGDRQLNQLSIGIEFVNPGPVARLRDGVYGTTSRSYGETEVTHSDGRTWANYPAAQIEAGKSVVASLITKYGPLDTLGHSEICDPPGRKLDPGPAFPWHEFRVTGPSPAQECRH
jgi:N-acetylmuramoyl-L-alanine amidase